MAYCDFEVFHDFQQTVVRLAKEVFEDHIQQFHPEIGLVEIRMTLLEPKEVWQSLIRNDVFLYYRRKEVLKERYVVVVVKKLSTGNFVSSAYTKSRITGARRIFPSE